MFFSLQETRYHIYELNSLIRLIANESLAMINNKKLVFEINTNLKYNKYIREVFGEDSLYAERLDDLAAGVPAQQELYP